MSDFKPVTVNVTVGDAVITTQGFGTPAILAAAGEGNDLDEIVNTYTIGDDITADYADDTDAYLEFAAMSAQSLKPTQAKIISRPADVQQQQTITFSADLVASNVVTITIDDGAEEVEVTYATSHSATLTALAAALAALTSYLSAATVTGARVITVTTAKTLTVSAAGTVELSGVVTLGSSQATVTAAQTVAPVTAADALTAALDVDGDWFGLVSASRNAVDHYRIATWIASHAPRIYIGQTSDANAITSASTDIGTKLQALSSITSALIYHGDDAEALAAAWMAFNLATDLDTSTGNWAYSDLTGITVNDLTTTQRTYAQNKGYNVYVKVSGSGRPLFGKMAGGRYIDIQVTAFWFQARLNEALTSLILNKGNAGGKLPNTDGGRAEVKATMQAVCATGEAAGHFEAGQSVVTVPALSAQSSSDKTARRLTGVSTRVRATGAINEIVANVTISV